MAQLIVSKFEIYRIRFLNTIRIKFENYCILHDKSILYKVYVLGSGGIGKGMILMLNLLVKCQNECNFCFVLCV